MGLVQVIIDDSSSKIVTGTYEFDRDNGGTLICPAGSSFPGTPAEGEWLWRTDEQRLYRYSGMTWDAVVADVVAHAPTHQNGGADEISVAGLSGELADDQPPKAHDLAGSKHNSATLAALNAKISDATLDDAGDPRDPNAHAASHQNGGSDEINVGGLSGVLADDQPAQAHSLGGAKHTADTLANLNAKITDATLDDSSAPRTPTAHEATHRSGGSDELGHQNLSGAGTKTHAQLDTHVDSVANPHSVDKAQVGLGNVTNDAQLKRAAADFASFAEKTVLVPGDVFLIEDSAAAGAKKRVQLGNVPGIRSVLEAKSTVQLSTTSTSWVALNGLGVTFTPKTGERVLVLFNGNLGNTGASNERTMLDIQHNNGGSYQRLGGDRGLQFIESQHAQHEYPSAFSLIVTLPNAVSTTLRATWQVDGGIGFLLGQYAPVILQVVRFMNG